MHHFTPFSWLSCTLSSPRHAFLWTSRLKTHQPAAALPPSPPPLTVRRRPQENLEKRLGNFSWPERLEECRATLIIMTCDEAENQRPLAGTKRPNSRPVMAEFQPGNKKAKIEVTLASSESGQLSQIESEFQILKSLIPDIANRQQINEVSFPF